MKRNTKRHVYIMRLKRSWIYALLGVPSKYKIGIANDVEIRRTQIQSAFRKKVVVVYSKRVRNARATEKHLHKLFYSKSINMNADEKMNADKAGLSEWFELTHSDVRKARHEIEKAAAPSIKEVLVWTILGLCVMASILKPLYG